MGSNKAGKWKSCHQEREIKHLGVTMAKPLWSHAHFEVTMAKPLWSHAHVEVTMAKLLWSHAQGIGRKKGKKVNY
jgi:hypothetical protein